MRRSLRGHDCQFTHELDLGHQRLLIPSPVLGMYVLPTVGTVGAGLRTQLWDSSMLLTALDGLRDWTQLRPPYTLWRFWWAPFRDLLTLWAPQTSLVISKSVSLFIEQSGGVCPFLWSLPALHVQGPVSDYTQESSRGVCRPTKAVYRLFQNTETDFGRRQWLWDILIKKEGKRKKKKEEEGRK